jgi:ribosomal protein L7Ae-like RNA K-turn-binding protein
VLYTIAVFKSRFSTINFANLLRENNIPVAIINTPQQIGSACSISVKFLSDFYPKVQALMSRKEILRNFVGFYSYSESGGRVQMFKL